MGRPSIFLQAEWRHLLMVNFAVDPTVLLPHVPRGTELDDWRGTYLASLVGFQFLNTRLRGIPVPFHRNFDELNLRFYVRRVMAGTIRRGVVFVKEIVPKRAVAWVARRFYHENYVRMPMRSRIGPDGSAAYEWYHDGDWDRLSGRTAEPFQPARPNSEEEFITEHYWGYTRKRDGTTSEYEVEHPGWRVARATDCEVRCRTAALYGESFVPYLSARPTSAFIADGSAVIVRSGAGMPIADSAAVEASPSGASPR